VKTAVSIFAIVAALALQTSLAGLLAGGAIAVNLVLVAVVYLALSYGAVTGVLAGMLGGIAQDALAGGLVGLGGMTKTLIGFVVGVLGAQFNLSTTVPRMVMFVAATFVHQLVFESLNAMIGGRQFSPQWTATLVQALTNGLIGVMVFLVIENGPDTLQRRRARRTSLSKRRF
jgi:rod shape-determining protein MreD